jgi:hypothetical protein
MNLLELRWPLLHAEVVVLLNDNAERVSSRVDVRRFIDDEASDDGDGGSDYSDQSDGDPTLGGFIVADDAVDERCGSASEPDGSAAAEGAGASAARGRTRSRRLRGA